MPGGVAGVKGKGVAIVAQRTPLARGTRALSRLFGNRAFLESRSVRRDVAIVYKAFTDLARLMSENREALLSEDMVHHQGLRSPIPASTRVKRPAPCRAARQVFKA